MDQPIQPELDEDSGLAAGRQLCELSAHVQAGLAEFVLRAAAFDDATGWGGAGIRSCAHWLSIQAGLDLPTSADLLRVGHTLCDLPLVRQAFSAGQLTLDKVRALLRVATPADEEVWLELALNADASQLVRICREVRRSMDADAAGQADELRARRGLWTRVREDGMLRLVALLPPEDGALVVAALESVARSEALPGRETDEEEPAAPDPAREPWAARREEALVAVCEHALGSGPEELVGAPGAVQMVVHVDVGVLTGEQPDGRCHLEDGSPLSAAAARRLGCDADVIAITEKDGLPIDMGRKKRLFTPRQRRALQSRDRTCRFPGCPVLASRTRGHHIVEWWRGGSTDIANGLSLCSAHHGRLHDGAFRIRRGADGELHFETPDGVEIAPPRRAPLDPRTGGTASLRRQHRERGLAIGPGTPAAGWNGERGDLHYVADVYDEAAARARARAGHSAVDDQEDPVGAAVEVDGDDLIHQVHEGLDAGLSNAEGEAPAQGQAAPAGEPAGDRDHERSHPVHVGRIVCQTTFPTDVPFRSPPTHQWQAVPDQPPPSRITSGLSQFRLTGEDSW